MRVERRLARRFRVPNATVQYRSGLFRRFREFEDPAPTANLSKGGLSFHSVEPLKPGAKVDILLDVPGFNEPLFLKCYVRYCIPRQSEDPNRPYRIGVGFKRYGVTPWCNPMEALEALRKLEEDYLLGRMR